MKHVILNLLAGFLVLALLSCGSSTTSTTTPSASLDSAADVAEVVAVSAGGMAQAGSNSDPQISTSLAAAPVYVKDDGSVSTKAITGFTYADTGSWAGTAAYGATPTLKFYITATGSLITVDATDAANYQMGADLYDITPINQAGSGIQMEVTVVVSKTFNAGYTASFTAVSEKVVCEPANIGADASYSYSSSTGTITGSFGTITMSEIAFTAADQGADVDGSYAFSVTSGGTTYTGIAQFDENGCKGATIRDGDGNILGTAVINDAGTLVFTDADTGETTTLTRVES